MDEIDTLWDYGHPAESEQRFRDKLATTPDSALQLELATQIARAQGLQRRYDDAHATLSIVERQLDAMGGGGSTRPRIRYQLERGRVWNSSGDPARARPCFQQAWETATSTGEDALAVDAAHMLAIAGEPHERLEWNRRALALADSSSHPRAQRWRASVLNNLGWAYVDRGELDQALSCFERAVEARESMGNVEQLRIARWAVAKTLRLLGRGGEALERQRELQHELECAGESDGYVHEELAECLLALGREDEAARHFRSAHDALSQDAGLATTEPGRIARLARLGDPPAAS